MIGRLGDRGLRRIRQPRAATALLLVLAVVAGAATVFPQRSVSPQTVAAWHDGSAGPGSASAQVLAALGLFDITGSWWWAVLVVVMVLACGSWVVADTMASGTSARGVSVEGPTTSLPLPGARRTRTATPRSVVTDTKSADWTGSGPGSRTLRRRITADVDQVTRTVVATLRDAGLAVRSPSPDTVIGERGRLRRLATRATHAAFPVLLAGVVASYAWGFVGQVDLTTGERAVDAPISYGDVTQGPLWTAADHPGFALGLERFRADFHADGTPDDFVADVRIDGNRPVPIRLNHPLRSAGMTVSLLRYGVAPHVRIVDTRDGSVVFNSPIRLAETERAWAGTATVHTDGGRVLDAALVSANTGTGDQQGQMPADPVLLIDVFTAGPDQQRGALVDQVAVAAGTTVTALDGTWQVTVGDVAWWAGFQVRHRAGSWLLLAGATLLLVGLTGGLWIRYRTVRVAISTAGADTVVVATASAVGGNPDATDHVTLLRTLDAALARSDTSPVVHERRHAPLVASASVRGVGSHETRGGHEPPQRRTSTPRARPSG